MTQTAQARWATTRMITGAAIVIVSLVHGPVQTQAQQQRALCYEKHGLPRDAGRSALLINENSAIIESGIHSARDLAVALTNRGLGYRQTHDYQRAFNDFDEAITLDSTYLPAYCERGDLYREQGDIERARQDFDQVTQLKRREAELSVEEF